MWFFLFFFCFLSIYSRELDIWPYPQRVEYGGRVSQVDPALIFDFHLEKTLDPRDQDLLVRACERYRNKIFISSNAPSAFRSDIFENRKPHLNWGRPIRHDVKGPISGISIFCEATGYSELQYGIDESYRVAVDNSQIEISSRSIWGILRGLETVSQLIVWTTVNEVRGFFIHHIPILIEDHPRFAWRGFLVDTARHYLHKETLYSVLDAMSYNKLNVLHWHIIDSESFPLEIKSFPNLTRFGAFSPQAIYTREDVQDIIAYARDRGIRVLPEIDTPGHTASWGQGYPRIVADCYGTYIHRNMQREGRPFLDWPSFSRVALDPTVPETYTVVKGVLEEVSTLFPDDYVHIGGDEVDVNCWHSIPAIRKYMHANGFIVNTSDGRQAYNYFALQGKWMEFVQAEVNKKKKKSIVWEEAFFDGMDVLPETLVNVWVLHESLRNAVLRERNVIMSYGWYLDRQSPICAGKNCEVNWMWIHTWEDMYTLDIFKGWVPTAEQARRVLGGEVSSWGESADGSNLDARVWTRAPAVAERLWSSSSMNDTIRAQPRLSSFLCKLQRRGIRNGPIVPSYCDVSSNAVWTLQKDYEDWRYLANVFGFFTFILLITVLILGAKLHRLIKDIELEEALELTAPSTPNA